MLNFATGGEALARCKERCFCLRCQLSVSTMPKTTISHTVYFYTESIQTGTRTKLLPTPYLLTQLAGRSLARLCAAPAGGPAALQRG